MDSGVPMVHACIVTSVVFLQLNNHAGKIYAPRLDYLLELNGMMHYRLAK